MHVRGKKNEKFKVIQRVVWEASTGDFILKAMQMWKHCKKQLKFALFIYFLERLT